MTTAPFLAQSSLLGASFVCWAVGLHLCGPAVTVIMEYIEVLLIRLWAVLTGVGEPGGPGGQGGPADARREAAGRWSRWKSWARSLFL